jgi:hypothetical protein
VLAVVPAPDGGYPGGNTAEGHQALFSLNGGLYNTANGAQTLYWNTTGNANTATGYRSLFNVTTAENNTATGFQALFHSVDTGESTATGYQTLFNNNGCCNTATGSQAMVGGRFSETPLAGSTRLTVSRRCATILSVSPIRLPAFRRFIAIPRATSIPPMLSTPCIVTGPAATTRL